MRLLPEENIQFSDINFFEFDTWNPGALNFPMAPTICIYCWSDLLILHGLLNFVFDRGKVNGSKFQP
jgi:hypothetical protein